jgi:ATP-dependent exoDNAse (exonuclease V) beta subunit
VAVKDAGAAPAVAVHPFLEAGDAAEAARVVEIARATQQQEPGARLAVLVRARTHLPSILSALRRAGLRYRAVEIDQLGDVAITQDLLALTRALLHPADRVAWLAVLRAPWCGLTLADLHALAAGERYAAVWDLMRERAARLSPDGQRRLGRVTAAVSAALDRRGERLRPRVEGCWIALGGPACATRPGEFENALAFFDLLEALDEEGEPDPDELAVKLDRLFAAADPEAGDAIEVMSIHKAKGLEFDVVVLPGLGRKVQPDGPRLLAWLERPAAHGAADLLLAPVKPAGVKAEALYDYVKRIEQEKGAHEAARMLYVAATRAKKRLHLLGRAVVKDDHGQAVATAPPNSLLACLWPAVVADFRTAVEACVPAVAPVEAESIRPAPLRRLEAAWVLPAPPPSVAVVHAEIDAAQPVSFRWAGDTLRHVGTVAHRMLQQVALESLAGWNAERVEARRPAAQTALRTLGVPPAELPGAVAAVLRAVAGALASERGCWILDNAHADARSEFALSGMAGDRMVSVRVDRTFVDQDGVRWIIDFKTSEHEGGDIEAFLDSERERYRAQMTLYAELFARLEPGRPVCMGLYFPLLGGWREYAATRTA